MCSLCTTKLFKYELDQLQKLDIIIPLEIDETVEWCNSFVLVPKANVKVRLCLDPASLNQALIRPVHRDPTLNDILPRLKNVKYMSIIDTSSGYHNLKLHEKSSYLMMFTCPFGWYHYKRLAFGAAPVGNMLQCKIDKIFSDMPKIFGIADDILVIGYDKNGANHDAAVHKVLWQCEEVNLKLNREKHHFGCTPSHSLGMWYREKEFNQTHKNQSPDKHAGAKQQKGAAGLLSIINYLGKFSPGTADLCDPPAQADIQQSDMDMECIVPGTV